MNHYLNRLNYYQDSLSRFIQSDRPIMLIMGQEGSGKAQLITQFSNNVPAAKNALKLDANNTLSPADIVNNLAQHWNLSLAPQENSQRKQLDYLITQLQKTHSTNLLIINNAHQLTISTLAALCHLESAQEKPPVCLHIILAGEVSLEDKITSLMTSTPPSLLLQPLTQKETFQYTKNKLQKLNFTPSSATLHKIYEHSGGFPNLINHLIQQWITEEKNKQKGSTKKQSVLHTPPPPPSNPEKAYEKRAHLKKIVAATCLMLIGIGYLTYHHTHNHTAQTQHIAHLHKHLQKNKNHQR